MSCCTRISAGGDNGMPRRLQPCQQMQAVWVVALRVRKAEVSLQAWRVTSSEAKSSRPDMTGILVSSKTGNVWSSEAKSSRLGMTGILVLRFSVHSVEEVSRLDMAGNFGLAGAGS